jgi:hypothetical protein
VIFREAVLGFLGVKDPKQVENAFCRACKKAKKNINCGECGRKGERIKEQG